MSLRFLEDWNLNECGFNISFEISEYAKNGALNLSAIFQILGIYFS